MYFAEVQKIYQLKNDKTFIKTLLKKKNYLIWKCLCNLPTDKTERHSLNDSNCGGGPV